MRANQVHRVLVAGAAAAPVMAGALLVSGCRTDPPPPPRSQYVDVPLPPGPVGLYAEGVLARNAGDEERAVQLLTQAQRQDPQLIMPNKVLGELYRQRRQYAESERFFRRMLELDPGTAQNYFNLAYTQELLERFRDASANYLQGLSIRPEDPRGNLGLGRTYLALGEHSAAVPYLERAAEMDPEQAEAWLYVGRAREAEGRIADAETAYRRGLEAAQDLPELIEALGANLSQQGRHAEALPLLEQAVRMDDSPRTRMLLGDALVRARRLEEAHEQYDAALAHDSDFVPALNIKGSVYILQYRQGAELDESLREQALELWRRSLAIDPNQPSVQQAVEQHSG